MSTRLALANCINQLFYHRIGTSVINYCLANNNIPPLSVKEKGHILATYFKRAPDYGSQIVSNPEIYMNFLKILKKKYAWCQTDTPVKACYNGASMGSSCSLFLYIFNPTTPRHIQVNHETTTMLGSLLDVWEQDASIFIKKEISALRQDNLNQDNLPSNVHQFKPKKIA